MRFTLSVLLLLIYLSHQSVIELDLNRKPSSKRSLLANSRDVNMTNAQDMQYYVTLYIGSKRQAMTFIIDSGSSWLWVPSVSCTQCKKATAFN
jgi:hypothetical protein